MNNKIKRFKELCTELSELVEKLKKEDVEMLYHTNHEVFSLVEDGVPIVEVVAPLMTLWD